MRIMCEGKEGMQERGRRDEGVGETHPRHRDAELGSRPGFAWACEPGPSLRGPRCCWKSRHRAAGSRGRRGAAQGGGKRGRRRRRGTSVCATASLAQLKLTATGVDTDTDTRGADADADADHLPSFPWPTIPHTHFNRHNAYSLLSQESSFITSVNPFIHLISGKKSWLLLENPRGITPWPIIQQ